MDYMLAIPSPYEGRLISVIRRWAGSGGWTGRWRCDAHTRPAVQAASSRCASPRITGPRRRRRPALSEVPNAAGARTVEKRLDTEGRLKGQSTGGDAEQTSNTARGTPLVWWTCGNYCFDKPRCREASRPVGPLGPLAFRAPSPTKEAREARRKDLDDGLPGAA